MRAVVSEDGTLVVVDGWAHVKLLFGAPLLPTIDIRVISFVHLKQTTGARTVGLQARNSGVLTDVKINVAAEQTSPQLVAHLTCPHNKRHYINNPWKDEL